MAASLPSGWGGRTNGCARRARARVAAPRATQAVVFMRTLRRRGCPVCVSTWLLIVRSCAWPRRYAQLLALERAAAPWEGGYTAGPVSCVSPHVGDRATVMNYACWWGGRTTSERVHACLHLDWSSVVCERAAYERAAPAHTSCAWHCHGAIQAACARAGVRVLACVHAEKQEGGDAPRPPARGARRMRS